MLYLDSCSDAAKNSTNLAPHQGGADETRKSISAGSPQKQNELQWNRGEIKRAVTLVML
jgi:hypothetical protein